MEHTSSRCPKQRNSAGFTLVELAIVIAIIGVVLASGLSVYGNRIAAEKASETARRLTLIEDALLLFRRTNGRLPFPANSAVISGSSMGAESSTVTTGLVSSGNALIGSVPTRTLNLPDSMMLDAYGMRITYAVDSRCANSGTWGSTCGNATALTIQDSASAARTNTGVYVLISHGANLRGAWQQKLAAQLAASPPGTTYGTTFEAENANNDNVFRDMLQRDTGVATTHFDDFVRWKVKNQL